MTYSVSGEKPILDVSEWAGKPMALNWAVVKNDEQGNVGISVAFAGGMGHAVACFVAKALNENPDAIWAAAREWRNAQEEDSNTSS